MGQSVRLIALIVNEGDYSNPKFKIINFVSDVSIKVEINSKNNSGKLVPVFDNTIRIPYTTKLKDLSIIVGQNGSGKTTIINRIMGVSDFSHRENYLIFESKGEIWSNREIPMLSLKIKDSHPNIIKFTNAKELYDLKYIRNIAIDASNIRNLQEWGTSNNNLLSLVDIIGEIQFLDKFQSKIIDFVDYSQKTINVSVQSEKLPFRTEQINIGIDQLESVNKETIYLLIKYFSLLINHIISTEYNENFVELFYQHLALIDNSETVKLQYQSISIDSDRFLPNGYGMCGLREAIKCDDKDENDLLILDKDDEESMDAEGFIKLWHRIYVLHLFFDLNKNERKNIDISHIESIIDKLKKDIPALILFYPEFKRGIPLKSYGTTIEMYYKALENNTLTDDIKRQWHLIWESNKTSCEFVAKAVSFTSYFDLGTQGYFVSHKLVTDKIFTKLADIGVGKEDIKNIKQLSEYLLQVSDGSPLSLYKLMVDCISKISLVEIKRSIELRWGGLSSGELGLLRLFSRLFLAKQRLQEDQKEKNSVVLLLDEVDMGLHPEWQRRWIRFALPVIEQIFKGQYVQIIMTTHSPIILSDIYKENIIFLTKDNEGKENWEFKKTFGQNIYSLYKNSFFLNKLMGEYAYLTIQDTIEYLTFIVNPELVNVKSKKDDPNSLYYKYNNEKGKQIAKKVIDSIGEPIIANQLSELFNRAFPLDKSEKEEIEDKINKHRKEIQQLKERLQNLEEGNSK